MTKLVLVFLGGGMGAAMRYGVGHAALKAFGPSFPFGTLVVNVVGSLAMGLLIGALARGWVDGSENLRLFAATGVLGGFTTFSAFSLDVATLYERGALGLAMAYVAASVVASVIAVFAGLAIARAWA